MRVALIRAEATLSGLETALLTLWRVGERANAFEIFEVSNPATPLLVSQSPLAHSGQPDDIFVSNKYAYIVEGGGTTNAFEIFNISKLAGAGK
jgi:hypothetical protein